MGMDFRDEVGKWVLEANMFKSEVGSELRELGGTPLPKLPSTGHLTGCAGSDPHNSLTSASSAHSEHFPHKTGKKCLILVIKQLLSILSSFPF